ncbi:spore coat protein U domain-containing protein [Serratia sp. M24T3]|uniref:Csu type fimbrial protein n=1 Tax=Serratia sp. M24T3 TaxID=932213 RepID=UPI00025B985F|nr:spore coat protein U domain-containing protein [Serratia sp. M24T3]EIC85931.1 Spore coat protein U [Serratia sp. M24T3]
MHIRNLLLLMLLGLSPSLGYAITCSVSNVQSVNFSTVNPLVTATPTTSMTFSYSCTRGVLDTLVGGVTLCFNIGASTNTNQVTTRAMANTGTPAGTLSYQLYQNTGGTVWGSQYVAGTTPVMANLGSLAIGVPTGGSLTVYGTLSTPQTTATPGSYTDNFSAATAVVTSNTALLIPPGTCGSTVISNFAFSVLATVAKQCTLTTNGNINLGSVSATAVNTASSNTLSVDCTNSTPYTIGLVPSNSSTTGAGVMSGTAPNKDTVPYQLRSTSGINGVIWGSSAANSIAGTGSGSATTYTVYATAASANYTPGSYSDTVTVNVTY